MLEKCTNCKSFWSRFDFKIEWKDHLLCIECSRKLLPKKEFERIMMMIIEYMEHLQRIDDGLK